MLLSLNAHNGSAGALGAMYGLGASVSVGLLSNPALTIVIAAISGIATKVGYDLVVFGVQWVRAKVMKTQPPTLYALEKRMEQDAVQAVQDVLSSTQSKKPIPEKAKP